MLFNIYLRRNVRHILCQIFFGLLFHTVCVLVHLSDFEYVFLFVLFPLVLISLTEDLSFTAIFFFF